MRIFDRVAELTEMTSKTIMGNNIYELEVEYMLSICLKLSIYSAYAIILHALI